LIDYAAVRRLPSGDMRTGDRRSVMGERQANEQVVGRAASISAVRTEDEASPSAADVGY
jgi:hypothetical protein